MTLKEAMVLRYDIKSTPDIRKKLINSTASQLKTFVFQRILSVKDKDNSQNGRKHAQII